MAYDASRHQVVLFGGFDANIKYVGDTWVWDGSTWRQKLGSNAKRKASLVSKPVEVFADYWRELSTGTQWGMGLGRFVVVTVTKGTRRIEGTVFETPDGTKFALLAAKSREEADGKAAALGSEARVFAVRPCWSRPAKEWVAADPVFLQFRTITGVPTGC